MNQEKLAKLQAQVRIGGKVSGNSADCFINRCGCSTTEEVSGGWRRVRGVRVKHHLETVKTEAREDQLIKKNMTLYTSRCCHWLHCFCQQKANLLICLH